ncbi:MAG: CheR family methyltransferase, partial [Fidelibacterota bacterium]
MELTTRTFNKIREIVYQRSGIALNENKMALVSARIGKRLRALELPDYERYLEFLNQDKSGDELVQLLDVISTNVTSFFRENDHFEFIREIFPEWIESGQRRFRFWSAACSTGEEPYSLAMTLKESNPGKKIDAKILATDLSTRVLEQSIRGVYKEKNLNTVTRSLRLKYFDSYSEDGKQYFQVKEILKKMVVFRRLNLSKPPFPMKGPLDAVFNCNVMIYFDNAGRKKLIDEIYRLLKPGGCLILGHAESLAGIPSDFKSV